MSFAEEFNPYGTQEGLDEAVEHVEKAPIDRSGPRWEQFETGNIAVRFVLTIRDVLNKPSQTFANMNVSNGYNWPLGFAVMSVTVLILGMLGITFGAMGGRLIDLEDGGPMFAAVLLLTPLFSAVGVAILMSVSAVYVWLVLALFRIPERTVQSAFRINCYIYGSLIPISAIPYFGSLIGAVLGLVFFAIAVKNVYGVSSVRALGVTAVSVIFPFGVMSGLIALILLAET